MLKSKLAAAVLAAMLVFTPVSVSAGVTPTPPASSSSSAPVAVWLIFGCASGIILAAAVANAQSNRPLTAAEATTCGLLFWLNQPRPR